MDKNKYESNVLPRIHFIESWILEGLGEVEIAKRLGICKNTLIRYKKKYKELEKALNADRSKILAEVEKALLKKAVGYTCREIRTVDKGDRVEVTTTEKEVSPDLSAISFLLRNYCPEKWSDRPSAVREESESGGVVILPEIAEEEVS